MFGFVAFFRELDGDGLLSTGNLGASLGATVEHSPLELRHHLRRWHQR